MPSSRGRRPVLRAAPQRRVPIDCRLPRNPFTGRILPSTAPGRCRTRQSIAEEERRCCPPGITAAGDGQDEVSWNVLGHRYFLKADGASCFCFETYDPPGTFVPPHIHPTRTSSSTCWRACSTCSSATPRSRRGRAIWCACRWACRTPTTTTPPTPTRALFWVSPAGKLKELFDAAARPHRHRRGDAPLGAARGRLRALRAAPGHAPRTPQSSSQAHRLPRGDSRSWAGGMRQEEGEADPASPGAAPARRVDDHLTVLGAVGVLCVAEGLKVGDEGRFLWLGQAQVAEKTSQNRRRAGEFRRGPAIIGDRFLGRCLG